MDTLIVSAADKIHNARAIVSDLLVEGDSVWKRFNEQTDRGKILDYYRGVLAALTSRNVPEKLLKSLDSAIKQMENHG